jgi:hypothetical protein
LYEYLSDMSDRCWVIKSDRQRQAITRHPRRRLGLIKPAIRVGPIVNFGCAPVREIAGPIVKHTTTWIVLDMASLIAVGLPADPDIGG